MFDGKDVTEDKDMKKDIKIKQTARRQQTMIIPNATTGHDGKYSIIAETETKSNETYFTLKVNRKYKILM